MNTHDIELPPLPEARIVSYQTDSTMRRMELRTYSGEDMKDYARAAIEADRKHFAELFMDLSRYADGMYEQDHDPQMEGLSDGYRYAAEFLLGNKEGVKELEADRKRRGEPLARLAALYDAAKSKYRAECSAYYEGQVDAYDMAIQIVEGAAPQPAEPVKVPSEDEGGGRHPIRQSKW